MSLAEILFRWITGYMGSVGFILYGCCSQPKVDTSGQVAAAQSQTLAAQTNMALGNRQLDLTEKQIAQDAALQREFLDLTRANSASDQAIKDRQMALMDEENQRRQSIFNPLEAGLVEEAKNYDSPERMANEMGKADAAVMQAYERAIGSAGRDQLRMGVNPNSAKSLALRENGALDLAVAAANSSTGAGERVKAKGFGMRMDAAGLGRNLVSNQTAAADSAVRAGQSSVNSMQSGIDQGNKNFATTTAGFGTAGSAFSNAGSGFSGAAGTYSDINKTQTAANDSTMKGVGSLVGTAASLFL